MDALRSAGAVTSDRVAATVAIGFSGFKRRFKAITSRAGARFESRDWSAIQRDMLERIDAYGEAVDGTLTDLRELGFDISDRDTWSAARALFRTEHLFDPYHEIAETFFNSVARMLFGTKGIDPYLEFLAPPSDHPGVEPEAATRQYLVHDDLVGALDAIVRDCRFHASWFDLTSDLERAAERLPAGVDALEVADTVFFRGKGAYVVGRLLRGNRRTPFAIAIRHERTGLRIAAVMVGEADLAVLFSYTRSAFLVACDRPSATVAFIAELLPMRKASEIYASIGFRKQAKTERYRELTAHLRTTDELFAEAGEILGWVSRPDA